MIPSRRTFALGALAAGAMLATLPLAAVAQTYPSKPIRVVVPFPAGSSTDIVARTVGARLGERLKQTIVVENKPGANGAIAAKTVTEAAPDGYTLYMGTVAQATGAGFLSDPSSSYMLKDLVAVTMTTSAPLMIVTRSTLPVNNVAELIDLARKSPKPLTFGSGGNGTANHLAGELINDMAKVKMQHIPYKGAIAAMTDVISGQIDALIGSMVDLKPQADAGKVRALAVTSVQRAAALPNVPAVSETLKGFDVVGWHGFLAPVGTPRPVIDLLYRETAEVLKLPDVRTKLEQGGATPVGSSPQVFDAFIKAEVKKWADVVKASGASLE
ncbi:tripartite tricarboxylate transporter substrate binding protein [Hydrogenophaga sp. BPS33]|uniref:tripartite tricarboxylate transporter substrate binding protein n=1 Tax=Hydrogenophaga sp. BPS33 TaxID=2651974 RepID=UPI00135ACF17|nr:tripartite tricarboxylate transporter substrate binding protein [Hydrogenophaga sp. BPS33]